VQNPSTAESWLKLIPIIDVVIEAVGGAIDLPAVSEMILEAISKAAQSRRPAHAAKLTYIYTSGIWVHGDNRTEIVTDTTPPTNPVKLVSFRMDFEQTIIKHPVLNGIAIRPAIVYGKLGSIFMPLLKSAKEGKVAWYGTPGGRYATVHVDDLADVYLRAAERASIVGGTIFDAANDYSESVDDFLKKLVEVSGAKGYGYIQPSNCGRCFITHCPFLNCL
jgi:nucleoside-diphosphate-sugar epimerase